MSLLENPLVQYFAAKNSQYYTYFPKLERSLVQIVNLGFSVYILVYIYIRITHSIYVYQPFVA